MGHPKQHLTSRLISNQQQPYSTFIPFKQPSSEKFQISLARLGPNILQSKDHSKGSGIHWYLMCMWCIKYLKFVTKFNSATIRSCLSTQNSVGKDAGSKSNSSSSSNSKCSVDKVASSSSSSKVTVSMVGWTMVGWRAATMGSAMMSKRTSLHSVHSCVRRSKRRWKGQILCRPKSFVDFFTQRWWCSKDCKRAAENLRGKRELSFDVYTNSSLMLCSKKGYNGLSRLFQNTLRNLFLTSGKQSLMVGIYIECCSLKSQGWLN